MSTTTSPAPQQAGSISSLEDLLYERLLKRLTEELGARITQETRRQRETLDREWKKLLNDSIRQLFTAQASGAGRALGGELGGLLGFSKSSGDPLSGFLASQGQLLSGLAQLLERAARDR
ncbi:MAG: hypothetical protein J0L97_03525 [Alphaproteobacteria bacterium]|nr:hypothetical protein [Alphaproteobacteria bacterium]